MQYIDLTHTFKENMPVYPGDPLPDLHQIAQIEKDGFVDHQLTTAMHVGTHMDAPAHMLKGGKFLHEYDPSKFFGRGIFIDARGKTSADAELLLSKSIGRGDIVLVNFGWSEKFGKNEYYEKYPELTESFANRLVELGASIVGMDTPSPDRPTFNVHKILLKNDIIILENLTNLEALIGHENFEIIALPMKLKSEAAPCRVIAKI